MLELPQWVHELATMVTLTGAGVWLVVHFVGIARTREQAGGSCARCEHNAAAPPPTRGRRSARLRVLG